MEANSVSNQQLIELFKATKTIAVVGISDKPDRSSYGVSEYMSRHYQIIPVNPMIKSWMGHQVYQSIDAIPKSQSIDIVNIFRRSEDVPPVVDQAIAHGCKCIWMQQGISNLEAAKKAREAGILVVMDSCIAVVHRTIM